MNAWGTKQPAKSRNESASAVRHNSLDFAILRFLWPSYTSHGSQLKPRSLVILAFHIHMAAIDFISALSAFLRTFSQLDPQMLCSHDVNRRVQLLSRPAACSWGRQAVCMIGTAVWPSALQWPTVPWCVHWSGFGPIGMELVEERRILVHPGKRRWGKIWLLCSCFEVLNRWLRRSMSRFSCAYP